MDFLCVQFQFTTKLREFFPKKTDLAKVTLDKLTEALMLINNRPRKCLGFKTPFDMFKHEIRKLI